MSSRVKVGAAVGAGVVALAGGAFFLTGNKAGDIPLVGDVLDPKPVTCPLSGLEPRNESVVERPAVAVKIENATIAYPLSGLDDAEIVFEELVEGGATRFMAIYHCQDSDQAGPVRSARTVDPAIMSPITRILAFSGANQIVLDQLDTAGIVQIEENTSGGALERIPREGLTMEHTLYADTSEIRKLGKKKHSDPPPDDLFSFGELEGKAKKASGITITFSGSTQVDYVWSPDGWQRLQASSPFLDDSGEQITVDNVLIEEHVVNLSTEIVDSAGNPSVDIADVTGEGRAMLFRDGKVIKGRWTRDSQDSPVRFETKAGDEMVFAPGSIWIELVPSSEGEVQGSFSYDK